MNKAMEKDKAKTCCPRCANDFMPCARVGRKTYNRCSKCGLMLTRAEYRQNARVEA